MALSAQISRYVAAAVALIRAFRAVITLPVMPVLCKALWRALQLSIADGALQAPLGITSAAESACCFLVHPQIDVLGGGSRY